MCHKFLREYITNSTTKHSPQQYCIILMHNYLKQIQFRAEEFSWKLERSLMEKKQDCHFLKYFLNNTITKITWYTKFFMKIFIMEMGINQFQSMNQEQMFCAILYHLYPMEECFSRFLNCTNGTTSRNASQMT